MHCLWLMLVTMSCLPAQIPKLLLLCINIYWLYDIVYKESGEQGEEKAQGGQETQVWISPSSRHLAHEFSKVDPSKPFIWMNHFNDGTLAISIFILCTIFQDKSLTIPKANRKQIINSVFLLASTFFESTVKMSQSLHYQWIKDTSVALGKSLETASPPLLILVKGAVRMVARRHSDWSISEVLLPSADRQALQNSPWAALQKHGYQTAQPYLLQAPGNGMSSLVCLVSQVPLRVSLQHHRDSWGVMAINSFENFDWERK